MTPEQNNVVRAQGRKCMAEIQQALKCRPKPKWNAGPSRNGMQSFRRSSRSTIRKLRHLVSAWWHSLAASVECKAGTESNHDANQTNHKVANAAFLFSRVHLQPN